LPDRTYTIDITTLDRITTIWKSERDHLRWGCLFVTPAWLKVWWQIFGMPFRSYLCVIANRNHILGIAPLMLQGTTARLMGSDDVCDYLDVVAAPSAGRMFCTALIDHLGAVGINRLDLRPLRPGSFVLKDLVPAAESSGCKVSVTAHDVSMEIQLPSSWNDYLYSLNGKARHEIRRKLRRLHESARIDYRILKKPAEINAHMDIFLELFGKSRPDKNAFLTTQREAFFRGLAGSLAAEGLLKLVILDLDGQPRAAVMCFDYESTMHLYNSGYDPKFQSLSVGQMNKIISIRTSIEMNKQIYDFMKGEERYKHRLGGKPIDLYRCRIEIG
jgi:CelD/BcsL family acetyltransferase involved in cellulose biosynthesis